MKKVSLAPQDEMTASALAVLKLLANADMPQNTAMLKERLTATTIEPWRLGLPDRTQDKVENPHRISREKVEAVLPALRDARAVETQTIRGREGFAITHTGKDILARLEAGIDFSAAVAPLPLDALMQQADTSSVLSPSDGDGQVQMRQVAAVMLGVLGNDPRVRAMLQTLQPAARPPEGRC